MAGYNIGGFTFINEAEAKKAQQELQLIEQLKSKADISEPAVTKFSIYLKSHIDENGYEEKSYDKSPVYEKSVDGDDPEINWTAEIDAD